MKRLRISIFIAAIILVVNLPVFNFVINEDYAYSNNDGSFRYSEEAGKGNSFQSCLINYGSFLCKNPEMDRGDNRLYRTFTIKPWRFWEWSEMLFSERYRLPYKGND